MFAQATRSFPAPMPWGEQIFWLLVLSIPIACIARTVVYEEVFREPRDWCIRKSKICSTAIERKFFYIFTCEYCFSHWIALFFLFITRFKLLVDGWQGYLISFFSLVFVSNAYLNLYARLRVDITQAKVETRKIQQEVSQNGIGSQAGNDEAE